MRIAIGADHGGFELKEKVKVYLEKQGHVLKDFGAYSEDSVDYNEIGIGVAEKVVAKEFDRGILICGTGIGMSIMANKVNGIRAALVHDLFTADATRAHNDSNVLVMGGRVVNHDLALQIADVWLNTEFSNADRHARRIGKIDNYKGE